GRQSLLSASGASALGPASGGSSACVPFPFIFCLSPAAPDRCSTPPLSNLCRTPHRSHPQTRTCTLAGTTTHPSEPALLPEILAKSACIPWPERKIAASALHPASMLPRKIHAAPTACSITTGLRPLPPALAS